MIVGVHRNLGHDQFLPSAQKLLEILKHNKIETRLLYAGDSSFWDSVRECDLVIFQWGHHDYYRQIARAILPVVETQLKIRCFPNLVSSWLFDDKIREYYFFKALNLPMIESWIFYDEKSAFEFVEKASFPLVFKIKSGAGSQMVTLLTNQKQAQKYIRQMFRKGIPCNKVMPGTLLQTIKTDGLNHFIRKRIGKLRKRVQSGNFHFQEDWATHRNYILFQRFLPQNQYDTRVVVIGRNAFAFQRFNRPNDFRASGGGTYSLDPRRIDTRFIKIALDISKQLGFDTMAYDFLYDENKNPAIAEISYTFGSRHGSKINHCPGYWDEELNFHNENPDVALFTLKHLLGEPNLSAPGVPG